jgi:hypothetical protein
MESSQHPSLLSHQHDFSSLVSWPHHWQPESFEITKNHISTSNPFNNQMTQVVPEHVARAKVNSNGSGSGNTNNNNVRKDNSNSHQKRIQRSNSATLSTISVTCDTDTSIRPRYNRHQPSSPSKKGLTSHSSNALKNSSVNPPPTSFRNHHQYKSSGNSSSSMSTSLTTASEMNIIHEKATLNSSTSTISIPNKHLIRNSGGGGGGGVGGVTGASGGSTISTKSLSNRHKATSFDDRHHRTNQNRGIRKSVLEHLVFVFPENVRRMLAGPKK